MAGGACSGELLKIYHILVFDLFSFSLIMVAFSHAGLFFMLTSGDKHIVCYNKVVGRKIIKGVYC